MEVQNNESSQQAEIYLQWAELRKAKLPWPTSLLSKRWKVFFDIQDDSTEIAKNIATEIRTKITEVAQLYMRAGIAENIEEAKMQSKTASPEFSEYDLAVPLFEETYAHNFIEFENSLKKQDFFEAQSQFSECIDQIDHHNLELAEKKFGFLVSKAALELFIQNTPTSFEQLFDLMNVFADYHFLQTPIKKVFRAIPLKNIQTENFETALAFHLAKNIFHPKLFLYQSNFWLTTGINLEDSLSAQKIRNEQSLQQKIKEKIQSISANSVEKFIQQIDIISENFLPKEKLIELNHIRVNILEFHLLESIKSPSLTSTERSLIRNLKNKNYLTLQDQNAKNLNELLNTYIALKSTTALGCNSEIYQYFQEKCRKNQENG